MYRYHTEIIPMYEYSMFLVIILKSPKQPPKIYSSESCLCTDPILRLFQIEGCVLYFSMQNIKALVWFPCYNSDLDLFFIKASSLPNKENFILDSCNTCSRYLTNKRYLKVLLF